jgi:DNA-binding MurR/RpiR family transcriptional regulator
LLPKTYQGFWRQSSFFRYETSKGERTDVYKHRIREIYEDLAPGYRRIADFLLTHYRDAAFMTAREIGVAVNVNTAQVVRFAQRLDYAGYPELIASVRDVVKRELQAIYKIEPEAESSAAILARTLISDQNNLEHMLRHLDEKTVEEVVEILATAPNIFVTAAGNYSNFTRAFAIRLVRLGRSAHTISNEFVEQAVTAALIKPGDVVLGIGMTTLTSTVATMLKLARAEGARTIGIVGALNAPVATAAELVLHAPAITHGLLPSWTALAAVMHGLTAAVGIRIGDPATEWMMRADYLLEHYLEILNGQIPPMRESLAEYNRKSQVDTTDPETE